MPSYTSTTIRKAFRITAGIYDAANPTAETGLSNDEIDEFLEQARRQLNQRVEAWTFGSFNTVAAQFRYSPANVSWPSNKIGTATIFWGETNAGCDCGPFQQYRGLAGAIGEVLATGGNAGQYFDQIIAELDARFFELLHHYFGGRGWEERDGYVWLDPAPTDVRAVYYFAPTEYIAAASDVGAEYANSLLDYAVWLGCSAIVNRLAMVTKVNDGAMIEVWNNPAEMAKNAKLAKARWDARFNALPQMRLF